MNEPPSPRPTGTAGRRPLASRDTGWAQALARRLVARGATPNGISRASIVSAAVAGIAFALSAETGGIARIALLLLAAIGCQGRLLCNLLDGLVAIEGGRATPTGAVWNEVPDRISDTLILVGAGVAAGVPSLGWAAAALALSTAYVRELGHRLTGRPDFSGWMAKPQRMAALTLACLLGAIATAFPGVGGAPFVLHVALWVITAGSAWVALARSQRLLAELTSPGGIA